MFHFRFKISLWKTKFDRNSGPGLFSGLLLRNLGPVPSGQPRSFVDQLPGLGPEAVADLAADGQGKAIGQRARVNVLLEPPIRDSSFE